MRARKEVLAGLMAAVVAFAVARAPAVFGAEGPPAGGMPGPAGSPSGQPTLRIYYTNPTIVRAGERVLMPVDVVCGTGGGRACASTVTIGVKVGGEPWALTSAPSSPYLRFDLTAPASRAIQEGRSGAVDFFIRASAPGAVPVSLGEPRAGRSLRFFVTSHMPAVRLPVTPAGPARRGTTIAFLPWGTGPMKAGVALGNESPTQGPTSFDVDAGGRVWLADALQHRVTVYARRRVVREARLPIEGQLSVAGSPAGGALVVGSEGWNVRAAAIGSDGVVGPVHLIGHGVGSEAAPSGEGYSVRLVPLDAVVNLRGDGAVATDELSPGASTEDGTGRIIRIARDRFTRVALVTGHRVVDAVELRTRERFGEIALAARTDRRFVLVVRVARDGPHPADRFLVAEVASGRIRSSFAVAASTFTDMMPLDEFRLAPDGASVLQLRTSPDGTRVLRYDVGGTR
jgi:hypothetical protein